MHQILVVFEHDSGKSVQIAKHVASVAREKGDACSLVDLRHAEVVDLRSNDAVLVVSPISRARERASVARFVRPQAARLSAMPGAFVSIGSGKPSKHRGGVSHVVREMLSRAGWSPTVIAQLDVGRRGGRVARSAGALFEAMTRALVRRGPIFEAVDAPDWHAVDDALAQILDVADDAFVVPTARSRRA